jgi:katanin p60 ATPase-containing subunit A1
LARIQDVDLGLIADMCADYSGADIACVCRDASMMSMRRLMHQARQRAKEQALKDSEANQAEDGGNGSGGGGGGRGGFLAMKGELLSNKEQLEQAAVGQKDFVDALKKINKSVGKEDLERYEKWVEEFGSA